MSDKKEKIDNIIRNHMMYAMGAGAIPIPLADLVAVTAVQLDMIKQICDVHDVSYSDVSGKAIIASLTGSTFARYGASIVKAVPGIGMLLGGISMAILSGASTYAVGQVCAQLLNGKASLDGLDIKKAKKIFDTEFVKGKEVAKEMKEKEGAETKNEEVEVKEEATPKKAVFDENDVYALLLKLGELRDKNIITEEEFEEKKKEMLSRF